MASKHLHKYTRVNIGADGKRYFVFKCSKPGCNHYIRKDLAEGKLCECNRCENPMVLDKFSMSLAKPHCRKCTKPKKRGGELEKIKELIELMSV